MRGSGPALTEAALYLALAPKSNPRLRRMEPLASSSRHDRQRSRPLHLRNAVRLMRSMGSAATTNTPTISKAGVANQVHMPEKLKGAKVYKPGPRDENIDFTVRG